MECELPVPFAISEAIRTTKAQSYNISVSTLYFHKRHDYAQFHKTRLALPDDAVEVLGRQVDDIRRADGGKERG